MRKKGTFQIHKFFYTNWRGWRISVGGSFHLLCFHFQCISCFDWVLCLWHELLLKNSRKIADYQSDMQSKQIVSVFRKNMPQPNMNKDLRQNWQLVPNCCSNQMRVLPSWILQLVQHTIYHFGQTFIKRPNTDWVECAPIQTNLSTKDKCVAMWNEYRIAKGTTCKTMMAVIRNRHAFVSRPSFFLVRFLFSSADWLFSFLSQLSCLSTHECVLSRPIAH